MLRIILAACLIACPVPQWAPGTAALDAPSPAASTLVPSWPSQSDSAAVWQTNQQLISIQWAARGGYGRGARQVFDSRLAVMAFEQARFCAQSGTLTHTRPDGSSPFPQLASLGYPYPRGQENGWKGGVVSDGSIYPWTPKDVVEGWLKSPGHRANLLGDFDRAGFGWARGKRGELVVFGAYGKSKAP